MIRILHIIQRLSRGGASRSLIAASKYSAADGGLNHKVISLLEPDPSILHLASDANLEVITSPGPGTVKTEFQQADIVQYHFWNNPELYQLLLSPPAPARTILTCHVAGDKPHHILTRELIDRADMVLSACPYTARLPVLQNLPRQDRLKKTAIVLDAPDFRRLGPPQLVPHEGFNVGYIGTVDFAKLHPHFIRMHSVIDIPEARIIVCGGGDAFSVLEREAGKFGLSPRLELRGYVEDVASVLRQLDVFGYPLCPENYSAGELVLQEAMYMGIPPVLFPYGGAASMVDHLKTGLIVKSETEYAAAIENLYRNPELRRDLGNNASDHARRFFGAENAARKINEIYSRVMTFNIREKSTRMTRRESGANLFVESLGETAPWFKLSLNSGVVDELIEAEERIAVSPPVIWKPGAGGILDYARFYPDDGHLRLWAGLIFHRQKRPALAAGEFNGAIRLGCNHWRVHWYMARAAAAANAPDVARAALNSVLRANPQFKDALELLRSIPGELP